MAFQSIQAALSFRKLWSRQISYKYFSCRIDYYARKTQLSTIPHDYIWTRLRLLFRLIISINFLKAQYQRLFRDIQRVSTPRLLSRLSHSINTSSVERKDWQRLSFFMHQQRLRKLVKILNFPPSPKGLPSKCNYYNVWLLDMDLAKVAKVPDRILPLDALRVCRALDILVRLQSEPMSEASSSNPPPSILFAERSKQCKCSLTACSLKCAIPSLVISFSYTLNTYSLLPRPNPKQRALKFESSSPTPPHLSTFRLVFPAPAPVRCEIFSKASLCRRLRLKPSQEPILSYSREGILASQVIRGLQLRSVMPTEAKESRLRLKREATLTNSMTPWSLRLLRSRDNSTILFFCRKSVISRTPRGPSSYPLAFSTSPVTAFINLRTNKLFWRSFSLA